MSVFATYPKTRHLRTFAMLLVLCAVIAGGIFATNRIQAPLTAAIRAAFTTPSPEPSVQPEETEFPEPREVDWDGVVVGMLVSGNGLSLRRVSTGEMFQAYFPEGRVASVSYDQPVRIRGRWTGISCAYRHTVFGDQCTPTVEIDDIEILPIMFE